MGRLSANAYPVFGTLRIELDVLVQFARVVIGVGFGDGVVCA